MDSKSLMIGDWVLYNGDGKPYPVQVAGITSLKQLKVYNGKELMWFYCREKYFEPIPLTAGMLENNDIYDIYEKDDIPLFRTDKLKTRYGFRFQNYHPCTISISANILYVHELQHLLRLCGLTELANNFRVN